MTCLRQRMAEDMQVLSLSQRTHSVVCPSLRLSGQTADGRPVDRNRRLDPSRSAARGPVSALRFLPLADEPVVLGVRPDPEPHDVCFVFHGKRPVVQANPH